MWVNQTNLTSKFDTFGLGHTLVTGFEISRETYDRTTYSYNINRYYPAGGFELARPPGRWDGPTSKTRPPATRPAWTPRRSMRWTPSRWAGCSMSAWDCATTGSTPSSSRPVGGTRLDVDSADRKLSTRRPDVQARRERPHLCGLRHVLQSVGRIPGHHGRRPGCQEQQPGAGKEPHGRAGHQMGIAGSAPGAGWRAVPGGQDQCPRIAGRR